ncbi:MAG: Nucleotidyltransferase domain protein [Chloroflexi bacterium ADurb.Bin325]|nr:MAG: Nucleotidyltransferase domain protein [Chloroflexi bacterium ADurb.Bin325]
MGIETEQVLLFGSHATGRAHEGSDIDLFIISADWLPYNERERLEILGIAAARILEPIQARGATPDEVKNNELSLFFREVLKQQAIAIA